MSNFIHLHNHSHYSVLDGAARVDQLVQRAADQGMDSIALTDHGNLYGMLDFNQQAKKVGIKPIFGCEVYVAPGSRLEKTRVKGRRVYHHLVLLAKNQTGYKNLLRLVSAGFLDGYYYRPRVDFELIKKYSEGLICLTACLAGEINQALLRDDWDSAKKTALDYREVFRDDFFLEIQNHGIPDEDIVRARMKTLSDSLALPLVATNDIHYIDKSHIYAHDMYICVRDQKPHDPRNMRYSTDQLYFKTQAEMLKAFGGFESACSITQEIADRCDVTLDFSTRQLPSFPIPDTSQAKSLDDYLKEVCQEGLLKRFPGTMPDDAQERLDFELGVIKEMGFSGYFLIVKDFIDYARRNDIRVGPGRGSAAGSLVAFVTKITNIDPLEYGLLFERFLNPERVSMPDIDIDFEDRHRADVIEYVRRKYGESNVAQIVTFGKMMKKAVLKDMCRVLGMSFGEADRFTKLIPERMAMDKKVKLDDVRKAVPELDELIKSDPRYEEMWRNASILEGMNRSTGVHPAGVVITPGPLTDFVPLQRTGGQSGDITTQWDGNWIDDIGLLKMDFLGLRALTVIKQTQRRLAERGIEFDIEEIPLDDEKTFALFGEAQTIGIFQFESSGMREYLKKLKPARLDDLIAMNALYRPGPMDNIPSFIERRHGREEVTYLHPILEQYLDLTYGIIVYQEQVMQIARAVGGFSLGEADQMRRAMGKKKLDIMDGMKVNFDKGAAERDISKTVSDEIWDLLVRFASYGFNKSHSAAYAWLAYQTAYLKANYTAEFMAAVMTDESSDTKKMPVFLSECKARKIEVTPPDVNESHRDFRGIEGHIRFGLGAIKNVGENAIQSIVTAREEGPFKDPFDFAARIDSSRVNRKVLESLIQVGALDNLEPNRASLLASAEMLLAYSAALAAEKAKNQISLFGGDGNDEASDLTRPQLDVVPEWKDPDRLDREKQLIGIYVSGHPLEKYAEEVETFSTVSLERLPQLSDGARIRTCGIITEWRTLINKRDKRMALGTLEDFSGSIKFMMFEELLIKSGDQLGQDAMVCLKAKFSRKSDDDQILIVDDFVPLEQICQSAGKSVRISIARGNLEAWMLDRMEGLLKSHVGSCPLEFNLSGADGKPVRFVSEKYKVEISADLIDKLRTLLQGHQVEVVA
jgi:DNA polymerase III subunit alpha